jgi:glycosyltransferase involved in cell wall biosynthesis
MSVKQVLISPVVLPEFRVGLYNQLNKNHQLNITVVHGSLSMPVFNSCQQRDFKEVKLRNIELRAGGFSFVWQEGFFKEVISGAYDIVVVQGNFGILSLYPALIVRWFQKKKTLVWMCAYERPGIKGWRKKIRDRVNSFILKLFNGGVAYSSYAKEYLVFSGMPPDQVKTIGNTTDVSSLNRKIKALDKRLCCKKLDFNRNVILFAGKFTAAKQINLLIMALSELVISRKRDDVELVLLGDGPVAGGLKMLAKELGLEDYIKFKGVVIEGKEDYFRAATVGVMPGSGGLFINDCMASRLPIVLSYSDGTHYDLINDCDTGVLFVRDDVSNLADKIEMLIDDELLRDKIADNAEHFIMTHYSIDKMAENFIKALVEL